MTDPTPDPQTSKVTRARAVTVGAADPTKPRRKTPRAAAAATAGPAATDDAPQAPSTGS